MTAVILPFRAKCSPSRVVIETIIERLIDQLDLGDAQIEDCEPEPDESSDDAESESWPEWHSRYSTT